MDTPSRLSWPDLEVPLHSERPLTEEDGDVATFLVARLLASAPATLEAEFVRGGPAIWNIRRNAGEFEEVFRSSTVSSFRSVLARFGAHYLDLQLYGGYVQRILTFGEKRWMCRFYMSNVSGSGYWIRAYAMHPVQ
jgi:hypothetical protein